MSEWFYLVECATIHTENMIPNVSYTRPPGISSRTQCEISAASILRFISVLQLGAILCIGHLRGVMRIWCFTTRLFYVNLVTLSVDDYPNYVYHVYCDSFASMCFWKNVMRYDKCLGRPLGQHLKHKNTGKSLFSTSDTALCWPVISIWIHDSSAQKGYLFMTCSVMPNCAGWSRS